MQAYPPPAVAPAPFLPLVSPVLVTDEEPPTPIVYEESYIIDANTECPPMEIGLDWFQSWGFRGSIVAGGGDDDLTFAGLNMLAIQPRGIGLDVSVKTWRENSSLARDHLWLGDANVVYEFANHRDVRARVGLGVNWLADAYLADAGFNLTTGIDLRLTENWLLDLEGDIGTIGSSDYLHGQISLARRFNTSELTVGYDYYDIGGAELSGIFAGLQFRF
jgi:hypothetical protein